MGNEVTPAPGGALSPRLAAILGALGKHAAARPAKSFGGSFLKFNGKTGQYLYGKDRTVLPLGTQVRVDFGTMKHGWVAWPTEEMQAKGADPKPLYQEFVPISDDLPAADTLPPMQAGVVYKYTMIVDFLTTRADRLVFHPESEGAVEALLKLRDEIVSHAESGMAAVEGAYPIIALGERHYQHKIKTRGTIYVAQFDLIGWTFAV